MLTLTLLQQTTFEQIVEQYPIKPKCFQLFLLLGFIHLKGLWLRFSTSFQRLLLQRWCMRKGVNYWQRSTVLMSYAFTKSSKCVLLYWYITLSLSLLNASTVLISYAFTKPSKCVLLYWCLTLSLSLVNALYCTDILRFH